MEEDILREIQNNEGNEGKNEIIEIDENEEIVNHQYENALLENNDEKKTKKRKKSWSKKKKLTIIAIGAAILLIVIVVLVMILFGNKKDNDDDKEKTDDKIVQKGDYSYDNGKLIFINDEKKEIGTYECKNKNEDLCYIANYSNEDDFDIAKKVYEDGQVISTRSNIVFNNYVFIYDNEIKDKGDIKLYDISKKKIVETYSLVKEVSEDKVIVKKDKKYGVLSFTENNFSEDIKFNYDYLGYILESDYLVAAKNNNYILIDFDGEDVSKSVPGEIKNFDKDNISVKSGSKYYVYDYKGEKRIEKTYEYIRFADSYFVGVDNSKLYVYDKDGYIMNGEGIKITGTVYNPKLIYNEELRQTGKEEAFSVYASGTTIRIEYDDDYVTINTNEGNYNKTLSYINYFAGKLYFYSDEDKTKLLGTYACSYANSVGAANENLENCFLAKEANLFKKGDKEIENGYLPIFNNRFVFISDTKSPNANNNIILYDLEKAKKLATYKEVDAGYHKNVDAISFVETAGNNVLAKNSNDSYGLINVLKTSVKGIIAFKDSESGATNETVSMVKEYVLFRRSDKTYHLYDIKGNEITKNIHTTSEIVDYKGNYVAVKNNSNYMIYDQNGKIVNTKENFIYIKLYDKFYVSINENDIINVYSYNETSSLNVDDGNNKVINSEDYAKSFEIIQENGTYKLAILKANGAYSSTYELNLMGE